MANSFQQQNFREQKLQLVGGTSLKDKINNLLSVISKNKWFSTDKTPECEIVV